MSDTTQARPGPALSRSPDRQSYVECISKRGFHRVAYVEWGEPTASRVAICVHGLTRQGRDFDPLACALAARGWRVICPDLAGRGRSGRLRDPNEYALPQYAMDLTVLISRIGAEKVSWIGTSLGGLIGIVMAGQENSPVERLVVNDIGPYLPWPALFRIGSDVGSAPRSFPSYESALSFYRKVLAPFGDLTSEEWDHLVRHSMERDADGSWRPLCDPGIAAAFRPVFLYNLSLWSYWDAVRCPTLVLRGAESDLLLPSTAKEMTQRGPCARLVEFPGCGHAPPLLNRHQVSVVTDWLDDV
ncbi:MAG: alpha/beta hydrolase [Acidisphaera sp.]|nr:alpha/beta hydrolase [Acidisphaera sp.]